MMTLEFWGEFLPPPAFRRFCLITAVRLQFGMWSFGFTLPRSTNATARQPSFPPLYLLSPSSFWLHIAGNQMYSNNIRCQRSRLGVFAVNTIFY